MRSQPTSKYTTVIDYLRTPRCIRFGVIAAERGDLVLETEGKNVDEIIVRGLSFFSVGEAGYCDPRKNSRCGYQA